MSIFSAAGVFGKPGIRIIVPAIGTIKPAPDESSTSLILTVNPSGRPLMFGSSESDFCVLAIQTARFPKPSFAILSSWLLAFIVYSTWSAPYNSLQIVSIFFSNGQDNSYKGLKQLVPEFIDFINSYDVAGIAYRIQYDKSVISETRLAQYAEEEVAAGATLVGPHRDDIIFYKRKEKSYKSQELLDLSKYGSRGEQRLAILWLKLAEVVYIEKTTGERPILLLDDIFSELDEEHRELVLDVMKKQQTIVTSAEREIMTLLKRKHADIVVIPLTVKT